MLEDIRDGSQTHTNVNRREARYKIRDSIRQEKSEWKGALKSTLSMGKGLHSFHQTNSSALAYMPRPYLEAMVMRP